MSKNNILRPRWGTYSVIRHHYLGSLVPEILLYDRLVFPTPTDEKDRERWKRNGWKPELLDQRIKELGEIAHPTPWTEDLRKKWSERWKRLKELGRDTKDLAMDLTPHVLALSAWQDRYPPPIMIAAYQSPSYAIADIALIEDLDQPMKKKMRLQREVCALFERRLEMPIIENANLAFDKAIGLSHNKDYQHARRSLFEWEDKRISEDWPTEAAIKELESLIDAHDELIKSTFRKTWKRRIYHVAEFVIPTIVTAATLNPFIGLAAGGALKLVKARLPSISTKPGDPKDSPGASGHMAISVMYHERSRKG